MQWSIRRNEVRTVQAHTRGWPITAPGHLAVRVQLRGEVIDVLDETAAVHLPALDDGTAVFACLVRRDAAESARWVALVMDPAPGCPAHRYGQNADTPPAVDWPYPATPSQAPPR